MASSQKIGKNFLVTPPIKLKNLLISIYKVIVICIQIMLAAVVRQRNTILIFYPWFLF